ncbi:MAG: plastocyanin/azurin family copper-binding protein, partial [Candidatus Nitrosocosmicus sp.]
VGPGDGYPYVLSYTGSMFSILPAASESAAPVPAPATSSNVAQNDTQRANSVPAVIIGIRDDASYAPNPIEISAGQTITWVNGDAVSHTVTSGTDDDPKEGELFDSDAIIPDQNYSMTFDDPGNYEYYCIYHPTMIGEVNVVSGNGDEGTGDEGTGDEGTGDEGTGDGTGDGHRR